MLSHHPENFKIEIELFFDDGQSWDDLEEEERNDPPAVTISINAVSPIWSPVSVGFTPDEVPLLVNDLATDGLFDKALAEAWLNHRTELDRLVAEIEDAKERMRTIEQLLGP